MVSLLSGITDIVTTSFRRGDISIMLQTTRCIIHPNDFRVWLYGSDFRNMWGLRLLVCKPVIAQPN